MSEIEQAVAEDRSGQEVLHAVERAEFAVYVQKRQQELRELGRLSAENPSPSE